MSAHVARVLRERRERDRQFVVIRRPEALADDVGGTEDDYGDTVFDRMDDGIPLALSDHCYVPRSKCPWLCSLVGLALMGIGAAQCYFAFHADYYAALLFDAGGGSDGPDRRQTIGTLTAAAAAAAESAATAADADAALQSMPQLVTAAADSGSRLDSWDGGVNGDGVDSRAERVTMLLLLLRSFAYVGPTVVGTGAFIITVSCVIVLESRDRIMRAMRNREVERTSRNKEFIYNAVMKRFVNETAAKSDSPHARRGRHKGSPSAAAAARAEAAATTIVGQTIKASEPDRRCGSSGDGAEQAAASTAEPSHAV